MDLIRISKYMSLLLRHDPGKEGLDMDGHGWVSVKQLTAVLAKRFPGFTKETLDRVVAENNKKRYSYSEDGKYIRANQGHSIDVDVEMPAAEPPEILWHGTADRFAASIERQGLLPQSRRYVHLSKDRDTAYTVGKRHGRPVIYLVKSGEMYRDGYVFRISANGVWQTEHVPAKYLFRQSEKAMRTLVTFGSHCIDLYRTPSGTVAYAGGGAVNMAVQAAKCGVQAQYAGTVGTDAYGTLLLQEMEQNGTDTRYVCRSEGKSAVCEVFLNGRERILGDYDPGVLAGYRLSAEQIRACCDADLCVMDLWGMQEDLFPLLKQKGACIAFDSADRPQDPVSLRIMPYTDLFFFSAEDDTPSVRETMRMVKAKGPHTVIAMLGENGSLALDDAGWHRCGIVPCEEPVDTMGAGDSYIGAFLSAHIRGKTITECMETAAACASEVLRFHGAFAQKENGYGRDTGTQ